MSNDVTADINSILGVKDCKTMLLGATLMDTDPVAGYDGNMTNIKNEFDWSPINSLLLYPETRDIETAESKDDKKADLSMASIWCNGFMPSQRGLPEATNMGRKTSNFLAGRSIITTDQIFKARSDVLLASLFPHLSWYGSKGERMYDKSNATTEGSAKLVRKGMLSASWFENPIAVRYMLRLPPNDQGAPDYVYLVGGSEDVIGDNLAKIPATVLSLYDQIKSLKEEMKKGNRPKGDNKNQGFLSTPKFLWYSYSGSTADPMIKANLTAKKMLRIIESVFFIRNYFAYAQNCANFSEVLEISWDASAKKPVFKEVEIEKILAKYDTIYAYCKNLCSVYSDIAKGDLI